MKRILKFERSAALALSALSALAVAPAVAQSVGNVGAANPAASGTPPGSATRTLVLGASVVRNEKIQTSGEGSAQVVFVDRTTLNIGRNSTVVIDEFVYSPEAGTGRMAISVARGMLRFVGGQVSHTAGATVRTPAAILGIRGGTGTVAFLPDCGWLVADHFGEITVANQVSQVVIRRPGYGTCVRSASDPIPEPFLVPQAWLEYAMAQLTSRPGQHGGAINLPTDAMAARYGLGSSRLPDATTELDYLAVFSAADSLVANRAQSRQATQVIQPVSPQAEVVQSHSPDVPQSPDTPPLQPPPLPSTLPPARPPVPPPPPPPPPSPACTVCNGFVPIIIIDTGDGGVLR